MRAHLARLHATYLVVTDPARATHPAKANRAAANPADTEHHPEGGQATTGGGAGKIGRLFDRVIDSVIDKL